MITGDGRHHQMLGLGIAEQFAVADQVPGVFVIGRDVDALATGVQLGRGPEQLASLTVVVVEHPPGLVVEAEGMAGHPVRPLQIHAELAGQVQHGALADRALKGEAVTEQLVAQHPVHDQPLAQGPVAHQQIAGAEHGHGGLQDQGTGHDDLGAALVDGRQAAALLRGHQQQPRHQLVDPLLAEAVALQLQRRGGILRRSQGGQGHGRAACAHQLDRFSSSQGLFQLGHGRIHGPLDIGLQEPAALGRQGIGLAKLPLQAHGADAGAGEHPGVGAIGQHELGGATTDVDDGVGALAEGHAREHPQIDQPGLLRPAHQIHLQAELLLEGLQELAAVGRLANGAGGGGHDLLHAVALRQLAVVAEGAEGPFHGLGAEVAAQRVALPEPGGGLLSEEHAKTAQLLVHLGDQQVDRVGADVDGRHPPPAGLQGRGGLGHGNGGEPGGATLPPLAPPSLGRNGMQRCRAQHAGQRNRPAGAPGWSWCAGTNPPAG